MDCQDVRSLLMFSQRGCEGLDATEHDAIQQHLERCPDCAALARLDRQVDATLGKVMRDVSVPADLKANVMKRLAGARRPIAWSRVAVAAALVVAVAGAVTWTVWPKPIVTISEVQAVAIQGSGWNEAEVEKFFEGEGLTIIAPREFDYKYLQQIDIVEFKKRRVARLSFRAELSHSLATADVLVLPHREFQVGEIPAQDFHGATRIVIDHQDAYTYLVFYRGDGTALLRKQA